LRGEFVRGWSDGRNVDTGRALGSNQADDNKSHSHNVLTNQQAAGTAHTTSGVPAARDSSSLGELTNAGVAAAVPSGGAEARPRNVALLYCIKV